MTIIEIEKKELRKSFEKKPYKVKSKSKDSTGETITNGSVIINWTENI